MDGISINLKNNSGDYQLVHYQNDEYVCTFRMSGTGHFAYAVLTKGTSFWNRLNEMQRIAVVSMAVTFLISLIMSVYLLQLNYRPIRSVMDIFKDHFPKNENEFDIIREEVLLLTETRKKIENDLLRHDYYLRENIFYTALTRNKRFLSNEDLIDSIGLDFSGKKLIPVSVIPFIVEQSNLMFALHSSHTDITFASLLENIYRKTAGSGIEYFKTTIEESTVFVFFVETGKRNIDRFYRSIEHDMNDLCTVFKEKFSLVLDIIIGCAVDTIDMLYLSYQEIRSTHMVSSIAGEHGVIKTPADISRHENGGILANEYVELLQESIKNNSLPDAQRIVNEYLLKLNENDYPFFVFKYCVFSFAGILVSGTPVLMKDANNVRLHEILEGMTENTKQAQMRRSLLDLTEIFFTSGPDVSAGESIYQKISGFVEKHYNDKNLCLTMIADTIGLPVKYISKLFKMETGQGLLNYIGEKRIEKAKELLDEHRYTFGEISEMVGYTNTKTFRRVFKKIEGINPNEYRDRSLKS
jgi:AraC-like DNA-binding protein